ncbi:helix-turn-helix domain-containing protein [Amycolatopsis acidiphila]|uniref:Helix-turn-helix transcriptional regulator n=1 Tax=Amycolatopsis acidiphila TaxID=715473 RepID=A0A557ZZ56_9PSEU|nr:helix-turn-helix domain-containing protein [Amycolatopsis acidiphila]TVT17296.1 helix-turn-helix transcriptional regulator [Amycolatopsis acidiphila]UIJ61464.1 helix-turn-helix domain-containing protein [Amycolatopsis acidiphila]GHG59776.1 transcriptional regulator [Amycolatopsis acidiphila]
MRIELSPRDVARIGLVPSADPLWELASSVRLLAVDDGFGWWRRWVRPRLPESVRVLEWLYAESVPGFLLPAAADLGAGLATVLGTGADRLRGELRGRTRDPGLPGWASGLVNGSVAGLPRLVQAMREYFEAAVEPHWDTVCAQVDADRELRTRVLSGEGVDALLASLGPALRWSAPTLSAGFGGEPLVPGGAGMLLVPTYFAVRPEVVLCRRPGPVRLGYPALHRPVRQRTARPLSPNRALGALLGPTRAAALAVVAAGCSTSELAARLGVTPSAVSKHTAVLRAAGLIATRRERNTVLHTLTPLGLSLLGG